MEPEPPARKGSSVLGLIAVCVVLYVAYAGFMVKTSSSSPAEQGDEGGKQQLMETMPVLRDEAWTSVFGAAGSCEKYKSKDSCNNDAQCKYIHQSVPEDS